MKLISVFVAAVCLGTVTAAGQDSADRYYQAIRNNSLNELKSLVKASGVDVRDKRGTTPLMLAALDGSLDGMKLLVDAGADVNAHNAFDATALMWCATDAAKVRYLISKGADLNARSKQGRSALLIAAATQGSSEIVKLMLDKGADLKKADADPPISPLSGAVLADDLASVRLLLDRGAEVHGPAGGFGLIMAASNGNVEIMKLFMAKGVPVDVQTPPVTGPGVKNGPIALGSFTPLILAVSYGGPDAVKLLLDAKANVNAQDVRGMTPLMLALALDHPDLRVVRMLVEHGADPNIKSKAGESARDWARKYNHPEVLKTLKIEGALQKVSFNGKPLGAQKAAQSSVDLLQRTTGTFFIEGGCPSCHAHNFTAMAMEAARASGLKVDAGISSTHAQQARSFWAPQDQALVLRMDAPGGANMVAYGLLEFLSEGVKPSLFTDAMVQNIAAQQQLNGAWHVSGVSRAPLADADFTTTAICIRSLSGYKIPARAAEFDSRIAKAAAWLKQSEASTTEDHTMKLVGLKWAGADRSTLAPLARTVAGLQREDGGWGQTPYLASDAYATGEALYALHETGMPPNDPIYRKGVEFLLKTQLADGSWHVKSRAPKFQPYFQSGFPHDHDQWISMTATAWATMAISYTLPESKSMTAGLR